MKNHLWIMFVGLVLVTATAIVAAALSGCGTDPHPPTSNACFDDPDVRLSCSTCASTPVCAWCASTNEQRRGCYPRDQPFDCDGEVVRVSDLCSELEDGLHRPAE